MSELAMIGSDDETIYSIYLLDKNPSNPTVYHCELCSVCRSENGFFAWKTFEEFLNSFFTPLEYKIALEKRINDILSNDKTI